MDNNGEWGTENGELETDYERFGTTAMIEKACVVPNLSRFLDPAMSVIMKGGNSAPNTGNENTVVAVVERW